LGKRTSSKQTSDQGGENFVHLNFLRCKTIFSKNPFPTWVGHPVTDAVYPRLTRISAFFRKICLPGVVDCPSQAWGCIDAEFFQQILLRSVECREP
jgi:hypothetical protein